MLTSLFGDLGRAREPDAGNPVAGARAEAGAQPQAGAFAATAIMESVATEVNARGQMVDRHSHDLVVTGSPAQAIRGHFAATRSDLDSAASIITIVDPTGLWASAVIKALSDAGGRPIERLHLRDHSTLRTLAMIERTTLVRRQQDTLRIYHADVRAPGAENAAIPLALMERSQMATVVIGTLQPYAVEALLHSLQAAAGLPDWRCPHLLFVLPPNAAWMANQVRATAWPGRLKVHVISESMSGASSVWNAMLGLWNQVRANADGPAASANLGQLGVHEFSMRNGDFATAAAPAEGGAAAVGAAAVGAAAVGAAAVGAAAVGAAALGAAAIGSGAASAAPAETVAGGAPATITTARNAADREPAATADLQAVEVSTPAARRTIELPRVRQAMRGMLPLDGMLACALIDSGSGMVLAHEIKDDTLLDIELAGAACAQVLRAHRGAALSMGLPEQIDEVMTTGGPRHQVMRILTQQPELFLIALLDRQRTNLALARFHLMELERGLR